MIVGREIGSVHITIRPHFLFSAAIFTLICLSGKILLRISGNHRVFSYCLTPFYPESCVCILLAGEFARYTIANTSTWVLRQHIVFYCFVCCTSFNNVLENLIFALFSTINSFLFLFSENFSMETEYNMASLPSLFKTPDCCTRAPSSELSQCL